MSEIQVVQASPSDAPQVARLFDAYRQFYRQTADQEAAERFLRERLENGESVIFVATVDGQAVGFTQLYPCFSSVSMQQTWILNDLFVAASSRRLGVGRRLLDAAGQFGKARGAKRLELKTEVGNLVAQQLYATEGWVEDDKFKQYALPLG